MPLPSCILAGNASCLHSRLLITYPACFSREALSREWLFAQDETNTGMAWALTSTTNNQPTQRHVMRKETSGQSAKAIGNKHPHERGHQYVNYSCRHEYISAMVLVLVSTTRHWSLSIVLMGIRKYQSMACMSSDATSCSTRHRYQTTVRGGIGVAEKCQCEVSEPAVAQLEGDSI